MFFALRMIDRGLAADRGIHLREQRRRNLDVVDAALIAGSGETGHVADDAAAERDHGGVAVETRIDQVRRRSSRSSSSVLYCSPSGRIRQWRALVRERCLKRREVQRRNHFVRHDQQVARCDALPQQLPIVQQPCDRSGSGNSFLRGRCRLRSVRTLMTSTSSFNRCTISSATARTWRPSVATVRLAIDS